MSLVLVIIGGLNWGISGLFEYNILAGIFGNASVVARLLYASAGLSSIYLIFAAPAFVRRGRARIDAAT